MDDIKTSDYIGEYEFKRSDEIKHNETDLKNNDGYIKHYTDAEKPEEAIYHGTSDIKYSDNSKGTETFQKGRDEAFSGRSDSTKKTDRSDSKGSIPIINGSAASSMAVNKDGKDHTNKSYTEMLYDFMNKEDDIPEKKTKGKNADKNKGVSFAKIAGYVKDKASKAASDMQPDTDYSKKSKGDIQGGIDKEVKGFKASFVLMLPLVLGIAGAIFGIIVLFAGIIPAVIISNVSNTNLHGGEQAIWQYLSSEGFSDYAIAGVLGCYGSESGHSADTVEGEYVGGFPPRNAIMADLNGYCVNYLFPTYARQGLAIAHSGYQYNGLYYPGLGLAQWTGPRAYYLLHYDPSTRTVSDDYYNNQWNDLYVQLDFMVHYEKGEAFWSNYKNIQPTAGESDEDCVRRATEMFFSSYELPGNHSQKFLGPRQKHAVEVFNQAKTFGGDGAFIWPCPASHNVTSGFGGRASPGGIGSTNHKGIDIGAVTGTEAVAAANGTVVYTGYNDARGNYVKIDHGGGYATIYQHLSGFNCSEGDIVNAGDVIGFVGSTGHSTGPHLHFEIIVDGTPVDPMQFFN
ncbi:MAG: peptidoglycan DD-metalloendopeptidase family protein [Eubacterium sp.]|nr:peptidoglycan DD-metalloendopeptidase family protein [Eubacterium sp.]